MDKWLTNADRTGIPTDGMKNIAVIGAGISGLAAAYLLSRRHRVHLFEKEGRLGGHTQTVLIEAPTGTVPLDTGFLVHNDRTYPNLVRLIGALRMASTTRQASCGGHGTP
jgi:uncharacterized protein